MKKYLIALCSILILAGCAVGDVYIPELVVNGVKPTGKMIRIKRYKLFGLGAKMDFKNETAEAGSLLPDFSGVALGKP